MKGLRKMVVGSLLAISVFAVGCASTSVAADNTNAAQKTATPAVSAQKKDSGESIDLKQAKLKITVGNKTLTAKLEDNAATRAFVKKLPTKLHMQNIYGREMCYRYGAGTLPTDGLRSDRYEVGDIVYWPPRGSFVILYAQNGEEFQRQQIGHIDGDVSFFANVDDQDITFEIEK